MEEDALLDAVHASVLAVGVRRTTMTDVARRAEVSRMTLYRRHPDVTSLMQALMTREFSAIVEQVGRDVAGLPTARARLVSAAVEGADRLTRHPLFLRILDVDPELLLPYMTQRLGAVQRLVVGVLEALVVEGVGDGSVAASDPAAVARTIELALRGFVLHAHAEGAEAARAVELAELRRMLDRYLEPEREA